MSLTWCSFLFSSALVIEKQQHRQWRSRSWSSSDTRGPTRGVLEITDSHQPASVLKVQHLPREGCSLWCLHKKGTATISCPGMAMLDIAKCKYIHVHKVPPTRMPVLKRWTTTSVGKSVEKLEPFCGVGGNAKWCSPYGRVRQFFKKLNRITT